MSDEVTARAREIAAGLSPGYARDLVRVIRTPGERVPETTGHALAHLGLDDHDFRSNAYEKLHSLFATLEVAEPESTP